MAVIIQPCIYWFNLDLFMKFECVDLPRQACSLPGQTVSSLMDITNKTGFLAFIHLSDLEFLHTITSMFS